MLVVTPMLIQNVPRLLVNQSRRSHPLVLNKTLTIGLVVSRRNFLTEEFLNKQPDFLPSQEEQLLWEVTSLDDLTGRKLIRFSAY